MAHLRRRLADKELELSTAKAELHLFERRYQNVVGPMYAELDRVLVLEQGQIRPLSPTASFTRQERPASFINVLQNMPGHPE